MRMFWNFWGFCCSMCLKDVGVLRSQLGQQMWYPEDALILEADAAAGLINVADLKKRQTLCIMMHWMRPGASGVSDGPSWYVPVL